MTKNEVKKKIGGQSGDAVLGAKIRKFRQQKMGCDQKEFGRRIGVSQAIISQWESGRYMPSAMALLAISRLAGEDADWWAEKAGPEYGNIHRHVAAYKKAYEADPEENRVIPLHGTAGAGPNRFPVEEAEAKLSLPREWFRDGQDIIGLRVVGDSMSPLIQNGFIALVDIQDNKDFEALNGKIVAARDEHGVCIKWLRKSVRGTSFELISQNDDGGYPPIPVRKGGYGIVGRVVRWIGEPPTPQKRK